MSRIIGSWGWRHPEWEKDVFYPDDLPSDWQLSYYSNEFDLVVVPASYWTSEGYWEDDWLDDVTDEFVFYIDWPFLQLDGQADYEKCAQQCQFLGEQMAAILVNNSIWQQLDAEQQQWFEALSKDFKVHLYNIDDDASREETKTDGLFLLRSDSDESLRDLSGRLAETLKLAEQSEAIKHIVLSNEKVEFKRLKELNTLINLF